MRVRAFTLMELLIAMMVSSLLLTVVVLSLQNFNKGYYQLLDRSSMLSKAYQHHSIVREDFLDHGKVAVYDFYFDEPLEAVTDSIYYFPLDSGYVARRTIYQLDSFLFDMPNLETYEQYQSPQETISALNKSFFSRGHKD